MSGGEEGAVSFDVKRGQDLKHSSTNPSLTDVVSLELTLLFRPKVTSYIETSHSYQCTSFNASHRPIKKKETNQSADTHAALLDENVEVNGYQGKVLFVLMGYILALSLILLAILCLCFFKFLDLSREI